ncbi:S-phase kinase-associated protein 2 isoform X6 [Equus przewalskii]|uniref:S-phase kinase-associated protein 2 isoform X6 n=1 Tax=Equus przewalskii TaxID=9798 RepID=A0ABM4LRN6_EQUPR
MHAFKTPESVDAMHRKHLQEIPDQSSNVTTSFTWGWDSSKTCELLSGMGVSALEKEEVDSENIPQELLSNLGHPQSPPRKRLKSKGNDKDFVIVRRPKLNRENFPGVSWDSLPDELLLGIFSCLCLPELLKVSSVCKRWYHLAFDESLWQTLDLTGRNLHPDAIGRLLSRGVVAFRCPRSFIDQPLVEHFSPFRVQHMDLSNSVIDVSTLHGILSQCSKLQNLSLEGLQLSDPIVKLDELNLSWCYDFTEKHVQVAVAHVSETITQLNLSGYRKNLQRSAWCAKWCHVHTRDPNQRTPGRRSRTCALNHYATRPAILFFNNSLFPLLILSATFMICCSYIHSDVWFCFLLL